MFVPAGKTNVKLHPLFQSICSLLILAEKEKNSFLLEE